MAFDRPIEADQVDDLGLLSSLIRAPIMWLLGGDDNDAAEGGKQNQGGRDEQIEEKILGDSPADAKAGVKKEIRGANGRVGGSSSADTNREGGGRMDASSNADGDLPPPDLEASPSAAEESEFSDSDKETDDPASLPTWPSVGEKSTDDDAPMSKKRSDVESPRGSSDSNGMKCPSSPRMDDLVAAMEGAHINAPNEKSGSPGPATTAVLSSQSNMTSASTTSLSASYSASTFSNHQHGSQTLSANSHPMHPSKSFTSSIIKDKKKMSWSDERGNRSLVEYFDDSASASRSKHWSAMRRNSWRSSSRRSSFDADNKAAGSTRRGEVRVIKSALKRSGSYSPPVPYFASNGVPPSMSRSSTDTSSSVSSSGQEGGMKSFRSISVIASSDSSRSNASDLSKDSDASDSMAGVTEKKLNAKDVQCVPSTLQVGSGYANGGLIIPRGGPADSRYYFPRGGPNDPRYQLILGTAAPNASDQQAASSEEPGEKGKEGAQEDAQNDSKEPAGVPSNPATLFSAGNGSPGHQHHFLPRSTGYVSPQYGFYVNITPPTPEMYAAQRHPGDKAARSALQQQVGYHQFHQNKYQAPSPIPEGGPLPQRFVGGSSVPRPSSKRASKEKDQLSAASQSSLKPTFTKNKKGMGMILAENHHGVWPTVPFG